MPEKPDLPGSLDRARDIELDGRGRHPWYRRTILALMALFCLLALFNVFGQRSLSFSAEGPEARLELKVPSRLKTGDIFEARFEVHATSSLAKPSLVLGPGWLQGVTLNTVEPAPVDESSSGDHLRLVLPPVAAGDVSTLWTQWQVNPTGFGSRDTSVALYDRGKRVATISRTTEVFP